MVTSRTLAKAIGDALGIAPESAELHLKTVRAAGKISFKGYGRAAAAMTSLDASRLLLAGAGSLFAKDSLQVLQNFGGLKSLRDRRSNFTLEEFLARRIESILEEEAGDPSFETDRHKTRPRRPFGSVHLAETALQLIEPMGSSQRGLPRFAIVRWLSRQRDSRVLTFAPEAERRSDDAPLPKMTDIYDVISNYYGANFFQMRAVKRDALMKIALAIQE
ncbi:hypothetical protein ASD45_21020 [Pseudolabrys sp. Root1462]|jgi:hypothetical protein|uniref:hypothetical protein n=1 Tax=Pseudolabrys sp. Root1462 TaxID=1736466 RepID=UPI0007034830|nr:hypothetical protein [Pseudolabrys sp. Root1462]KQY97190.1 hypothetical protein ASD45_21020 [Pseudolabrys sp. Root1462]